VVSETYQLPLNDGRKVPINLYVIRKDLDQEIVLYWYQSHGRVVASEYWGKFYMVYDALRLNRTDAALVRITAPVRTGDIDAARAQALAFAKQVSTDVDQIIPR
jgi:EpsI family protein